MRASAVGTIGDQIITAWIEENAEISSVKARVLECDSMPAPTTP